MQHKTNFNIYLCLVFFAFSAVWFSPLGANTAGCVDELKPCGSVQVNGQFVPTTCVPNVHLGTQCTSTPRNAGGSNKSYKNSDIPLCGRKAESGGGWVLCGSPCLDVCSPTE